MFPHKEVSNVIFPITPLDMGIKAAVPTRPFAIRILDIETTNELKDNMIAPVKSPNSIFKMS